MTYRIIRATFRLPLCIVGFSTTALSAQESCYEQYFREHNKEILATINENDNNYDELKKEVIARQVLRGETPYAQYISDRYDQPATKVGVQAQVFYRPVVLAIDTVTGNCHLLAEDGTILAEARIAMVDSTWYMWLSVDPLADKNIANTPYMYCSGNPVMLIDEHGDSTRLWVETKGVGHTWIATGEGENQTVYSYGRYDDLKKNKDRLRGLTMSGEGVLLRLTGDAAKQYLEDKQSTQPICRDS